MDCTEFSVATVGRFCINLHCGMKMAAVSRLVHFSFDSNPLFTLASKKP
jgi:hypothetical protein